MTEKTKTDCRKRVKTQTQKFFLYIQMTHLQMYTHDSQYDYMCQVSPVLYIYVYHMM